ncbi:MAG: type II secretion system F family protein [Verrucomicrobia bacterium]|nr:type II secretion system F family protein [Verrucomicrobiota bacterium]
MNHDELSFVNQQLAGMLKSGVPLEGALRELCVTMQRGALKDELLALEADLAKGTPLKDAIARRKLPEFYIRMVQVGAQSGDLPGVLLMLADYYARVNALWTRLKGLMVYPFIVCVVSAVIAAFLAVTFGGLLESFVSAYAVFGPSPRGLISTNNLEIAVWVPFFLFTLAAIALLAFMCLNGVRARFRSLVPGFREANLSQLAASLSLMLRSGTTLKDALELAAQAEAGSPMAGELKHWQQRLAEGRTKFSEIVSGARTIPPLFVWLVAGAGENLALGFGRAAELYHERAVRRIEMILYAVLPTSVVMLGVLIVTQAAPFHQLFLNLIRIMDSIGME